MGFRITVTLAELLKELCESDVDSEKNSKDLLEYIQSKSPSSHNSTKTFDFSTLYISIPHSN